MHQSFFMALAAGVAMTIASPTVRADTYPSKPVHLVIPFTPGGSNDTVGRYLAESLQKKLGQPFVVENRGGAGTTVGTDFVAKSTPDGYTLLLASTPHVANPALFKKLPYDSVKGFAPISRVAVAPVVISVFPGLGVDTLQQLVARAKAKPGSLSYVSSGNGSYFHLASKLFETQAGISMLHVPYKGAGAAMIDVAAGHADVSIGSVLSSLPLIRAAKLKPLAVSGAQRQASMPNVPTVGEAGYPAYSADNWWGVLAPAGTPPDVVAKLDKAIGEILASPEARKYFGDESAEVAYQDHDDFARFMTADGVKWTALIKQNGLTVD